MDDVPWLYVAMIFIAFVSWIINRLQEASAARRQAREGTEEEDWEDIGEYHPPASQTDPASRTAPASAPPARPRSEAPQSLAEVYREIERKMVEAKRQREEEASPFPPPARAPQPASPPPLPSGPGVPATSSARGSSALPRQTARTQAAPKSEPGSPLPGTVPQSARNARLVQSRREAYAERRDTRDIGNGVSRMLRNRSNLRVALLLKEILDEPVSMRQNSR